MSRPSQAPSSGPRKLSLDDLSVSILRQALDRFNEAWALQAQPRPAEIDNRLGIGVVAVAQDDECLDGLAPLWIGHADHRGLHHGGMVLEHLFDKQRRDVDAPAVDHLVQAT